MDSTPAPASEELIDVFVRYGELDNHASKAAVTTMACEDCIASGADCGRTYVVVRTVVDPGEGDRGRDFDLSMELEDALHLGEKLIQTAREAAAKARR